MKAEIPEPTGLYVNDRTCFCRCRGGRVQQGAAAVAPLRAAAVQRLLQERRGRPQVQGLPAAHGGPHVEGVRDMPQQVSAAQSGFGQGFKVILLDF